MMLLEQGLVVLTVVGFGVGGLSIYWARAGQQHSRIQLGHRLFLATFLVLAFSTLLAAFFRANGLPLLGLCLGLLVVGMVWEIPNSLTGPEETLAGPESQQQ